MDKPKTTIENIFVNKNLIFADSIVVFITVMMMLLNEHGSYNTALSFLIIITDLLMIVYSRVNNYLLVTALIISFYNYSICMAEYISVTKGSIFTSYAGTEISNTGLVVLVGFNMMLFLIFSWVSVVSKSNHFAGTSIIEDNNDNKDIVFVIIIVLILIWMFGFGRPTRAGERGAPTTYYEYSVILFILGFYYSGKSKIERIVLYVVAIMYAGLNFVYGGRATGIQVIICVALCTVFDKIPKLWLTIGGGSLFVILTAIGSFRTSTTLSLDTINSVIASLSSGNYANDTAFSAYHTSLTMIDFRGISTFSDRAHYFMRYLLSIILGGSVPDSNLSLVTRDYYTHYYGGVLPYYFYYYFGFIGILIISGYVFWLMSMIVRRGKYSSLWRCIGIYVASTTFRWYIFSPSQITRGVLIMTVLFVILKNVDTLMKKSQSRIKKPNG